MDNVKQLLIEEIESEFGELEELELGSSEYKSAVDGITKLVDRVIEMEKVEREDKQKTEGHRIEEDKIRRDFEAKSEERKLEEGKINQEFESKSEDRELEERKIEIMESDLRLKRIQTKDAKTDQSFRNGIAIAGIVIPAIITIWGTVKTLKFEETGTVTTIMGRGFIGKLIPKK